MSSVLTYCPSQLLSADTVTHDSMAWGDWLHQPVMRHKDFFERA